MVFNTSVESLDVLLRAVNQINLCNLTAVKLMLNNVFSPAAKKHTVAITLYSIYITIWLVMCYLTYYYLTQGDGDILEGILFYWTMGICIPYLIVNIILSYYHPTDRRFFHEMSTLIFIPISMVILVWIEHGVIAYYRKGI